MTADLADRLRVSFAPAQIREVRMFGALCFMVDGEMAVAVQKDGGLLVRVDQEEDAALLRSPGAGRAEMGAGRSMGPGWIRVDAQALATEGELQHWIDAALRRRRSTARSRADA